MKLIENPNVVISYTCICGEPMILLKGEKQTCPKCQSVYVLDKLKIMIYKEEKPCG